MIRDVVKIKFQLKFQFLNLALSYTMIKGKYDSYLKEVLSFLIILNRRHVHCTGLRLFPCVQFPKKRRGEMYKYKEKN